MPPFAEPLPSQAPRGTEARTGNAYTGRWRMWYSSIADELIRNPKATNAELARALNRSPSTISFIVATDLFRDYFAQRRAAYSAAHDATIRNKLLGVTEKALDVLTSQLETKKDQIPIKMVHEIVQGSLEKLGYGVAPAGPSVAVQVNTGAQTVVVPAAALSELEAARSALRAAEAQRTPFQLNGTAPGAGVVIDAQSVVEELMEDRQGASE